MGISTHGNFQSSKNIQYLFESGVLLRGEKQISSRLNLPRKLAPDGSARAFQTKKDGNSFDLGGSIQTFFILWGTAVILTFPMFGFEVRHRIYEELMYIFYSI